jgi:predicted nucleotidyltransferase component of viral defense system
MSILTPLQKEFLKQFPRSYLGSNFFFLTGGTALAEFYLHHRRSQDLDFFTLDQNLSFDVVNAEILKLANKMSLKIEHQITSPTFLQYILTRNHQTLKIDMVKDVPIHFGEVKTVDGLMVDSLENIAVGKLLAIFGRADAKDFIDLYFLLERDKKFEFDPLFEMARKKDLGLHEMYLAQMIYQVEKIDIFPETIKPFNEQELKDFFLQLSEDLLKRIKPAS